MAVILAFHAIPTTRCCWPAARWGTGTAVRSRVVRRTRGAERLRATTSSAPRS